ncbi:DUF4115 domain-containing protein [Pacificimonas sp. WHA3]|uniref:DUF4115 domain-containing protein n=1 Tax=Pacificimonas pallii TaxID=2827236 RepID=A0ABS6SGD3_9SPHN|nr:helix-turn-helix domain-containing protein [Pacificimonas pallii]MBV7257472.1 DUF4115 domain-containing protein [Pacificimonas pallii]
MEETDNDVPASSGPDAPLERAPESHIGTQLQSARLDQGRELSDIAAQTRVPLRHLTAIEERRHDDLPALPYTLGFVKNYARAVGMDPDAASAQFRSENTAIPREPRVTVLSPIDERRAPPRSAVWLGILLIALVVLIGLAYTSGWFGGENNVPDVADDPLEVSEPVVTVREPELVEAAPDAADDAASPAEAALPTGQIVISVDANVSDGAWMRVSDRESGEKLFERVLAPGESFAVPEGRSGLILRAGNAGVLDIAAGGTSLPKIGAPGDVIGPVDLTSAGLAAAASAAAGE